MNIRSKINLKNDEGYYKDEFEGHKKCGKCNEIKSFSSFHKHKSGRFGLRSECKDCTKKRQDACKEYRIEKYRRYYDAKHGTKEERDKRKKEKHDQYIINKKQKHKEWLEKNKDEIKKKRKERYFNNREDACRKHKEWRSKNKEHLNEVKRLETKELRDNYIKREIRGRSNINRNDIPQSLIETYRELLKVKRLIKTETL